MRRMWRLIFWTIMAFGAAATVVRFGKGLGAATNLSDEFPWGLWVGFDVLVGVGLAAGGFVIAATVNIFQIKGYQSISRPAILTAFLGYVLVIFALMFDLGRPYRIWHPLVMGNPHSVMFEVAMCVMFYTTVLALEFSPVVFAKLKWKTPIRIIHAIYLPLVIVGVLLSTLHQSSLGTLYVIVPDKLYGLWYTSLLPVFFFLSAIAAGLAMTIFESFISYRAFGKRLEHHLLEGIARVIVVILAVLLVWRFQNLADRGVLGLAFVITPESVMFWGEVVLGMMVPAILFVIPRVRASQSGLFLGATLTVMGFVINRLNVAVTGMARSSGVDYVPSWMEFAVTISIVAAGFALFGLAVKHLALFPAEAGRPKNGVRPADLRRPAFAGRAIAVLWVFLLGGFVLMGFAGKRESEIALSLDGSGPSRPGLPAAPGVNPADLHLVDGIELSMGEDSPGQVVFDHTSHVDRARPDCRSCHLRLFTLTREAPPVSSGPGVDGIHPSATCTTCHNGDDAFSTEDDCDVCHGS